MDQRTLTDDEIHKLLSEPKELPGNWEKRMKPRAKANVAFLQRELDVQGKDNTAFRVILRQSALNILDFSIILMVIDADGAVHRLVRFNGRHPSAHTNKWERDRVKKSKAKHTFRNVFHIHTATERYQAVYEIDGYAEVTTAYNSFESALALFVKSNGFVTPDAASQDPNQPGLFP